MTFPKDVRGLKKKTTNPYHRLYLFLQNDAPVRQRSSNRALEDLPRGADIGSFKEMIRSSISICIFPKTCLPDLLPPLSQFLISQYMKKEQNLIYPNSQMMSKPPYPLTNRQFKSQRLWVSLDEAPRWASYLCKSLERVKDGIRNGAVWGHTGLFQTQLYV